MTPQEAANDALSTTLIDVQSLMKHCMKLKEANPETFRLLDEIACTFESVPDWTSVAEDNPRIKTHPRFKKTLGYHCPSLVEVPANLDPQDAASSSATAVPSAADPVSPTSALPALPASQSLSNPIAALAIEHKLVSPVSDPMAVGIQSPPPIKFNLFVAGTKKKSRRAAPQVGNTKKRKAKDKDTDVDDPKLHPPSSKPRQKRKKKFLSADKNKVCTWTIYVKSNTASDKDSDAAGLDLSDAADDESFLEVETRPAEWGQDSQIAMPWKCQCQAENASEGGHGNIKASQKLRNVHEDILHDLQDPGEEATAGSAGQCAHVHSPNCWSRRLDLLATNERVDALEVRVHSVENILHQRLDALEQKLNTSDAQ
ncbi:hypothetical protein BDR06DRAFT_972431 [Suillus hirtellus]|nr:hypothetical protein BDR06DRAFT_972431 [Suillus hirtellus]